MAVVWVAQGRPAEEVGAERVLSRIAAGIGRERGAAPFVVAVAGSVAVGKSTFAAALAGRLDDDGISARVVGTDAFLWPNAELDARGLTLRKGFPESYDEPAIARFLATVRDGRSAEIPVYSHRVYDIVDGATERIDPPEVLVLEGVNALAGAVAASVDRGVFLAAAEPDLERWYCDRFLALCAQADGDPQSFYRWAVPLDPATRLGVARTTWQQVNLVNLRECIAPTAAFAAVQVEKGPDHALRRIDAPAGW